MLNKIKHFASFDKIFCWSFLGWLGCVVGICLAIYFAVYYKRAPKLALELLSDTSIVDLKEDSKNLDIVYAGESIKATEMTLRVLTIRIVNEGSAPLRKEDYIPESPLGFAIGYGEVIDTPVSNRSRPGDQ